MPAERALRIIGDITLNISGTNTFTSLSNGGGSSILTVTA